MVKYVWEETNDKKEERNIMSEFLQTILIAIIPSAITGILSYLASLKNANAQVQSIKEQNKADIEKLIQQYNIDIQSLKEKQRLELEMKEKEHQHEIELLKLQHENDLRKEEEHMKNQLVSNALGGIFGGIFSKDGAISNQINKILDDSLSEAMESYNK